MKVTAWKLLVFHFLAFVLTALPCAVAAQNNDTEEPNVQTSAPEGTLEKLTLTQAFMCEKVENNTPINQAAVFSVSVGQVCCFTSFDPVPQPTLIYHKWYHSDDPSTQIRLRLYPPLWSTYSQIQLRETDKGPWRVEVIDQNGKVFDVIRFSITD
jgi:hypothetical protein